MIWARLRTLDYRRMAGFVAVGGTSAVATIAVRALLMQVVPFEAAVALSHVFGLTMAFTLNRLFVFTSYEGRVLPAYLRFFVVNLLSLAIATATSSLLYRVVFTAVDLGPVDPYSDYLAHFIGLGFAAAPSYFGHSRFSFRNWSARDRDPG